MSQGTEYYHLSDVLDFMGLIQGWYLALPWLEIYLELIGLA